MQSRVIEERKFGDNTTLDSCGSIARTSTQHELAFTLSFMLLVRFRAAVVVGLLASALLGRRASAQSGEIRTSDSSRAQLLAKARTADSLGRKEEAFLIRTRLREGDFEVGDHIYFSMEAPGLTTRFADSLVVLAGKVLRLPEPMGDVPVGGLLLTELGEAVRTSVDRYYKKAVIRVDPLFRILLSGAVARAGFYYLPGDVPLGDVIMRTGGQSPVADLRKITIRRGDRVQWGEEDVLSALSGGMTLQSLGVQPGDEIVVGTRYSNRWTTMLQYGLPIVGLLISITQLSRRR